ncbi:MAG: hypothetical protein EOP56_08240 [Sphingobacteriales bacterium]|nr:MAG: hypothetical protein EOP56_08240 [Sphingobacteriales bacterium]
MTLDQFNSEERKLEYEITLNGLEFQDGILKIASLTQKFSAEMSAASHTAIQVADAVNTTGVAAEKAGDAMEESKDKIDEAEEAMHKFIKSAATVSFKFLKSSLAVFDESQQAMGKLELSLRSTGYAAGFSAKELEAQANYLQQNTLYTDEAAMGVQTLLAGFKDISGDNFSDAVPAVLDLATAIGGDLEDTASGLGGVLADPVHKLGELEKAGVRFSDSQKDMIASMVKNNDLASAQQIVLGQLRDTYGGAAEAAASAGAGPFTMLQNQARELKEGIGGLVEFGLSRLAPVIELAMEPLKFFSGALYEANEWVRENETAATFLVAAVGALALAIGGGTLVMEGATIAANVLAAAEAGLNAVMNANPIGLIVTGLLAFGAVVAYAWENVGWFRGGILGVFYAFEALSDFVSTVVVGTLQGLGDMVKGIFTFDTDLISSGFDKATDSFKEGARKIGSAFKRGMDEGQSEVDARAKEKKEQPAAALAFQQQTRKPGVEAPITNIGGMGNSAQAPGTSAANAPATGSAGANPAGGWQGKPPAANSAFTPVSGVGVDKVGGNTSSSINITINDGLVKVLNFTTNNYQEGMTSLREQVAEALTGAIRDSQIVAV